MTVLRFDSLIDATPEEAFELYMDTSRRSEWNPSVRRAVEQSEPPNQAGSRYVLDTRFGQFEVRLLRVEPPHLVEMVEAVGRPGESRVIIRFERLPDGRTRLVSRSTFEPRGRFGRLTAPLNAAMGLLWGKLELRRFKAAAERTSSLHSARMD